MKEKILTVADLTIENGLQNISFSLDAGDQLAITGPAGSGKTLLGKALAGKLHYKGTISYSSDLLQGPLVWIEQQHHFRNLSNTTDFYYQQRYNSQDADDAMTVAQYLGQSALSARIVAEMQIAYLLDEPLIQLSNGENKKVQLAKALLLEPRVIVMDQPFVGLDAATREYLHHLVNRLANSGIQVLLITQPNEIPQCITKVLALKQGKLELFAEKQSFERGRAIQTPVANERMAGLHALLHPAGPDFEYAIRMRDVTVRYGDRIILDGINWEVKRGERWLLTGPNGAGKSTLLSLVTGDNPQAYANEIYLFDRRRGSGESIWDIKKQIGFLSPELHLFFDSSCTAFDAVASGLFDTIGLFRQLSDEQIAQVHAWLQALGIAHLSRKRIFELSTGEQRLVLLTRALIKDPPLLILDEPCQGLDDPMQDELLALIDELCIAGNKTLVMVTHYADKRPDCVNYVLRLERLKAEH